jgi:Rps23 Pro-64 3,4-dihydroxylase Tpa1-like proline 4-hydroxylase
MTLVPTIRKTKYLNNRDLLAEIHKSKCSYSSFAKPEYSQHDIILPHLDKVNIRTIAEAKRSRAKRLGLEAFTRARLSGDKKIKLSECTPDYKTISKYDIVIRIMIFLFLLEERKQPKQLPTVTTR